MHSKALTLLATVVLCAQGFAADFDSAASAYRGGNYAAAFAQFKPLAEAGDARAQSIVAMMYKYGEAVEQDWSAAFTWYERAAAAGYAPAQFALGEFYADGKGVAADRAQAIHWLSLAAKAGLTRANERLKDLQAGAAYPGDGDDRPIAWSTQWQPAAGTVPRTDQIVTPTFRTDQIVTPTFRMTDQIVTPTFRMTGPAPVAAEASSAYRVQLGAMRTLEKARALWNDLVSRNSGLLSGIRPLIERKDVGAATVYVVQTGPYPSLLAARRNCETFQDNGVDCYVLRGSASGE